MRQPNIARLAVFLLFFAAALLSKAGAADMMSVQVKQTQLRETPAYVGRIISVLNYGDRVTVLEKKPGWIRCSAPQGQTGWINASALTTSRIDLRAGAGGARMGADDNEVATAGKGFNQQVEKEFRAKHKNVDFTWVDKMEAVVIAPERRAAFLREGQVGAAKGGAQ